MFLDGVYDNVCAERGVSLALPPDGTQLPEQAGKMRCNESESSYSLFRAFEMVLVAVEVWAIA